MPEKTQPPTFLNEINELNRRLRMIELKIGKIEERLTTMEKFIQQIETDVKILKDIYDRKILELKEEMATINERIEAVKKSSEQFVMKNEFQKIKLYLDIFNPLKSNFITKEELENRIEEVKKSILKQENKI